MRIKPEDLKNYIGKKIRTILMENKDAKHFVGFDSDGNVVLQDYIGGYSVFSADNPWETYEEPMPLGKVCHNCNGSGYEYVKLDPRGTQDYEQRPDGTIVFQEPKKKVKMWKWIVRQASDDMIAMTSYFYSSEENAKKHFNELKLFFNPVQRADWTEIEVEE